MRSGEFVLLSFQLTVMLASAAVFGQLFRRLRQPAVLGEMIGGIVLGPTLLGALLPSAYHWLFHSAPSVTVARDAAIKLGMLFFLFIAGLQANLGLLRGMARRALLIGAVGTLLPILFGVGLVYLTPPALWGPRVGPHHMAFALFIGMNFANLANPVIARILMDLGLLRTELGAIIMTATVIDDLINWTLFAIVLSDIRPTGDAQRDLPSSVALVLLFFVAVLWVGRRFGGPALRWIRRHVSWTTGFIAVTTVLILLVSGVSEQIGIHAFLGAFLIGAALGGDDDEKNEALDAIKQFALSFFAPLYFVSMGLSANFAQHFDLGLALLVTLAACVAKIGAVLLGARLAGMPLNRQALAIAFGLNARGATGIILAGVGLEYGVIDERVFVAMIIMALTTSLISSPVLRRLTTSDVTVTSMTPEVQT